MKIHTKKIKKVLKVLRGRIKTRKQKEQPPTG